MARCDLDGCNKKIPFGRGSSKYCSDDCKGVGKKRRMAETFKKLKPIPCARVSCNNIFKRNSAGQKFCPECKTPGATYNPKTDTFLINGGKPNNPSSFDRQYKDFRTSICRRSGKQCKNFSACSDTVLTHVKGAFKYQTNGGIDCYEKPRTRLASGYNSIAACTNNHGCR